MQFFPPCRHFIPLRSNYSPQHPVLKHPQSLFSPLCCTLSFTPIQNYGQNYSPVQANYLAAYSSQISKTIFNFICNILLKF
jgi:hypothetical protein